jgi:hypothetical protein
MARVTCPFCLKPHDFSVSHGCTTYPNEVIPDEYISEYDRVQPLWLLTVGFKQHGKTTYLAALTLVLENMSNEWEGMYDNPLDQETTGAIQKMRRDAMKGDVPKETKQEVPRPILLGLYGLPETGSRCLVMYDVAGEIFDSISEVQERLAAIKLVSTTWFLISLRDLESDEKGRAITDLFNVYRSGMRKLQADLKGRTLIVIYTKADQVAFTPEIEEYLVSDPYQGLTLPDAQPSESSEFSLQAYGDRMKEISGKLEDYTRKRVKKGAAFISMVRAEGMNLYFSAVSALGQSPDSSASRLREKARRYRVLDPFLWALTLQMSATSRAIGLVVDGSSKSDGIYDLVPQVWERLSNHGDVTSYYLGGSQPKSQPGQHPPTQPPYPHRKRLIGPILEQAAPETRMLVLAAGPVADLADFINSPWRDRLVLVLTEDDQHMNWPHTFIYRKGDDTISLVNILLNL